MSERSSTASGKPVLGLFDSELELRDHLAQRLDLIEPGLTHVRSEYPLDNPTGAGGRLDILARDALDHVVCIEIKRSDRSAREALNELSKYITLLVSRDRVPREMIRCIVVSTHWHELLLPLSYFAQSTGVDVKAFHAVAEGGRLRLSPQALKPVRFDPQFSPDMDFCWFDDAAIRARYVKRIEGRAAMLPFVRLALMLFEPILAPPPGRSPHLLVICVWRLERETHDQVEAVIGQRIGEDAPYVAPGWEAETDAKSWLCDFPDDLPEVAAGWQHGTPEILQNLMPHYALDQVERIGDWPRSEFINDAGRLLTAALAGSPLGGGERANRHSFRAKVTPSVGSSWRMGVQGFLDFIAFEPAWRSAAATFLETQAGNVSVELHAFDKKHLVYAIHQARFHEDTSLSFFEIVVHAGDQLVGGLIGRYAWNGLTCPPDAFLAIKAIYGSVETANWAIRSAVDQDRYETALALHGMTPLVAQLQPEGWMALGASTSRLTVGDFVGANPDYSRSISEVLERQGSLPTDPSGSHQP
jgi:hypothetical protein